MEGLLAAAREVLGMELAYLAEHGDDGLVLRDVDGDTAAYGGVGAGFALPADFSWCHAMVAGQAPQLVTDASALPQAAAHPFMTSTGLRAYAGVPVRRADGSLFGSLCCISRRPQPDLRERDLRYLAVLARMAAKRLAEIDSAQERRRAELEAAAARAGLVDVRWLEPVTTGSYQPVLAATRR
jgi:GAF domain-containing protein